MSIVYNNRLIKPQDKAPKRFQRKWISSLFALLLLTSFAYAESTVFSDPFDGSNENWASSGVAANTAFSVNRSGVDWGIRKYSYKLELSNDISVSTNATGWVFGYNTASLSSPYNTSLSSNGGYVTWSFNMRQMRSDPEGFASGNYGVAYILAGTSTNANNTGTGYAVVLGQSGTTDPVRLIKYSGGLAGTLTNLITSNTSGLTDFGTEILSIAVLYNPANDRWELLVRNDGSSTFTDPRTGTLASQGTATDNTYTGTPLDYTGCYWQGANTPSLLAYFDNIKITVTAKPTAQPTALTFSSVHSTFFTASFTAASSTPDGYLVLRKTGSAPTSTPVDGVTYTVGNTLGDGLIVSASSNKTITPTGLTPSTTYYYKVFSYNGAGVSLNYLLTNPLEGNQSTSSVLIMWLKADALGLSDGTPVGNWTDQSGSNRNAIQDTVAYKPTYRTNIVNGKPALVFDGTNDYMAIDGSVAVNTNYTIFAVVRRAAGDNSIRAILGGTNPSTNKNMHLGWRANGTITHAQFSNDYDMKVNTYSAAEAPIIVAFRHSNTVGNDTYINGGLRGMNMNGTSNARFAHLSEWTGAAIGRYFGGSTLNTRFNGWMAEIKIYDAYLTDAQRKAVESELSTKYNIPVYNTGAPNYYADLNEISLPSAGSVARNYGGLTITGTYISAFSRIRAGHNAAFNLTTANNPSISMYPHFQRLQREWFLEFSGSINTSFSFDLDALGLPAFTPSGSEYRLLFRNDTKDNYTVLTPVATVNGRLISFSISPLAAVTNNGFYTLGTLNSESSTLPVELSSFNAILNSHNTVNLSWITQSETGVNGFYIYRGNSPDLANAMVISGLIPASNTSQQQSYIYTDNELSEAATYYYWLQIQDLDGATDFFGPHALAYSGNTNPGTPAITLVTKLQSIYPNPFNPSATISYSLAAQGNVNFVIFNTRGQRVRQIAAGAQSSGNHTLLWNGRDDNGQSCSSGIYYFTMYTANQSYSLKAVLMK